VSTKLDDSTPSKNNPMLLSEEQVEQEQVKPAASTKLDSDNVPTDDKPASLSQENADSDDKDKAISFVSNDNADKSDSAGMLGTTGGNNDMSDEDSDSMAKTINTNVIDPFASLN